MRDEYDIRALNPRPNPYIVDKEPAWKIFLNGLEGFTDDMFSEGRDQGEQEEREEL